MSTDRDAVADGCRCRCTGAGMGTFRHAVARRTWAPRRRAPSKPGRNTGSSASRRWLRLRFEETVAQKYVPAGEDCEAGPRKHAVCAVPQRAGVGARRRGEQRPWQRLARGGGAVARRLARSFRPAARAHNCMQCRISVLIACPTGSTVRFRALPSRRFRVAAAAPYCLLQPSWAGHRSAAARRGGETANPNLQDGTLVPRFPHRYPQSKCLVRPDRRRGRETELSRPPARQRQLGQKEVPLVRDKKKANKQHY